MTAETDFFDLCIVCRDRFVKERERADKAYNTRKEEITRGYKGELAQKEARENKEKWEQAKDNAVAVLKHDIETAFIKTEAKERARVSAVNIGSEYARALDSLKGVPISREEFELIAAGCAGRGYWVTAKLKKIAEENGILSAAGLDASYSEKMSALNEAKERLFNFAEKYDPDSLPIGVDDRSFRRLEGAFSGGFVNYHMSAEKKAALLVDSAVEGGDIMSTAVKIKNILETCGDDAVRAEILKRVSDENSGFWSNVRDLGGLSSVLSEYSAEVKLKEKEALNLVKDARLAGEVSRLTDAERAAALWGSSISPENAGDKRRIDSKGLEYIRTDEGKQRIKEFEISHKKAEAFVADRLAEAKERERIENG